MKHLLSGLLLVLLMFVMTCCSVWAQATSQISGTVRDQSGAVLPGVEVTATQTDTGLSRSAVTNETGSFILPNLAVGPYRFEATLPGFRSFVQTGIVLQVDSNPVINPALEVGQVTEQVEVKANATLVDTRTTAVGKVIENERILELPLNGRQVTDLIALSGAAVQTGVSNTKTTWQGGAFISIAGGQSFGVMYSLDGAMHNNGYDGTQFPMPFPDALQEFKVEASGFSAAGTRGSGGQVNAVTKSGTNEFHGNLFEFVRNYDFNARNFFALQRDTLKRNQYGGTLGGPIVRNKLFFFGGYQGTNTRSDGAPTIGFVPTSAMLAGDFRAFSSPSCNAGRQINLSAPFSGNQINPALYNPIALAIAAKLPKAQNDCGSVTYGIVQRQDEQQVVSKVDYQRSASHSLFGRYIATTLVFPDPYAFTGNILMTNNNTAGFDNLAQSFAFGSTYLMGPSTVNAVRLTVNRTRISRVGAPFFSAPSLGVKAYSSYPDYMLVSVTGGFTLGSRRRFYDGTTAYQLGDDLSLIHGNHQITVGGNLAQWRSIERASTNDVGNYAFNGTALGLGMADFLTGRLTTLSQQQPVQWTTRQPYVAAYAADVWKAGRRLTVNYGLRWEPLLPLRLTEGAMSQFDEQRFLHGIKSTVYPNAPAGLYFPGDPGFPATGPINRKWGLMAPRVGFAWDLRGDGRTSIRASYGYAYDFSGSITLGGSSSTSPWGYQTTVQSPAGGLADPWLGIPGGNPFPYDRTQPRFPLSSGYYYIPKFDTAVPTVQSWNLTIQRQVARDFLLSASYLGNQTTHLWVMGNINRAVYFPGAPVSGICSAGGYILQATGTSCSTTANTNNRRRLTLENPQDGPLYGNMATREDSGTAHYNGLLISIQRRAARGLNIGANYTWSHCLGDQPTANTTGTGGAGYLDPNNRAFDRGNCADALGNPADRRQIFNMTAVAETPQFANPKIRRLGTGWRLSGIYRASTGDYMTLTSGLDRVLSGSAANQRPNQILGDPYGNRNSIKNFLNPNAFAQPALGTIGDMRQFNIQGPGNWQLDMALSRIFQLRESRKLEVRVESFNVTNTLRRADPTTALNSNTFGQIISTSADPRIMQFAVKYVF
jgi:hypothetical protein